MNAQKIGEKLKALRGTRALHVVAEACGITPQALSNYENGIRVPRDQVKKKLADYYEMSVEAIFFS